MKANGDVGLDGRKDNVSLDLSELASARSGSRCEEGRSWWP